MGIISYTLDTLPQLTEAERVNLKKLAGRPEKKIDHGDIAPMAEGQWKHARRGEFYRPAK